MLSPLIVLSNCSRLKKKGIEDSLLYVRSERKAIKKLSMNENFTSHFETGLNQILLGYKRSVARKRLKRYGNTQDG